MKVRNNVVFILFLLVGVLALGQNKKWSLAECVDYALENNISIKQSELDVETAEINRSNAVGNFLPNISSSANHSWNIGLSQNITTGILENATSQFTSFGVSLGVNVYNGLQNVKQLHRANLVILANKFRLDNMKDNTALAVANAYLQILFNKEILEINKTQLKISNLEIDRVQKSIKGGILSPASIFDLEANQSSLEQQVILAQNNLIIAKINLAQLLRIEDVSTFDVEFTDLIVPISEILLESPKDIYEKSLTIRNDIKASYTDIEIAKNDFEIAKGALKPTVQGFVNYNSRVSQLDRVIATGQFSEQQIGYVEGANTPVLTQVPERASAKPLPFFNQFDTNAGQVFGLSVNIPIFSGFRLRNNVEQAKINIKRAENTYDQQKMNLESTINQAYNDAKNSFSLYEATQKTTKARKIAFENAQKGFEAGVRNSFEYSQTRLQYEAAQSDEVRAKFDYIFKLKVLEFYFGLEIDY